MWKPDEIKEFLKARPIIMIDDVIELEPYVKECLKPNCDNCGDCIKRVIGIKNVTDSDVLYEDNSMPTGFVFEALMQLEILRSVVKLDENAGDNNIPKIEHPGAIALINSYEVKRKVIKGDKIFFEVKTLKALKDFRRVNGKVFLNDKEIINGIFDCVYQ